MFRWGEVCKAFCGVSVQVFAFGCAGCCKTWWWSPARWVLRLWWVWAVSWAFRFWWSENYSRGFICSDCWFPPLPLSKQSQSYAWRTVSSACSPLEAREQCSLHQHNSFLLTSPRLPLFPSRCIGSPAHSNTGLFIWSGNCAIRGALFWRGLGWTIWWEGGRTLMRGEL